MLVKGLSHWRRRCRDCRDWLVAATRETKKWLALSPRRCRRDWSVAATRETTKWLALSPRRRQGGVSETSPQVTTNSPRSRRNISSVSLVSSRSRRRRVDVSPVAHKISLRDIAATDGDVAETSPQSRTKLVSATSPQLMETSRRHLRDLLETGKSLQKKKSNTFEFPATPRRPG